MSDVIVRKVMVTPVSDKEYGWVDMTAWTHLANGGSYVELPEPFWMVTEGLYVTAWTEALLQRLDRLGITFAAELHGPILMPHEDEGKEDVRVWYSHSPTGWKESFRVAPGITRVVDEFMAGEQLLVNAEDREFLAAYYPYEQEGFPEEYYDTVCEQLGVVFS